MSNLGAYLKDMRDLEPRSSCAEDELVAYSVKYIRSLFKGKVVEQLQGAETVKADDILKILDSVE
jgi:hypothetical protein